MPFSKAAGERLAEFIAAPPPGSRAAGAPRVPGTLQDDEQALAALWRSTGGEDGGWDRSRGWASVGEWMDLCSAYTPPDRSHLRPALSKAERERPAPLNEVVKASVPSAEGIVILRARVQNVHLFSNSLEGRLPKELGLLTHLKVLSLHSNQLMGEIPESISSCALLQVQSNSQRFQVVKPAL